MLQIHRRLGRWAGCCGDAWPILLAEFALNNVSSYTCFESTRLSKTPGHDDDSQENYHHLQIPVNFEFEYLWIFVFSAPL